MSGDHPLTVTILGKELVELPKKKKKKKKKENPNFLKRTRYSYAHKLSMPNQNGHFEIYESGDFVLPFFYECIGKITISKKIKPEIMTALNKYPATPYKVILKEGK